VFARQSKVVASPGMSIVSPREIYLTTCGGGGGFTRNAGCRKERGQGGRERKAEKWLSGERV
jgi:hypothetical protein